METERERDRERESETEREGETENEGDKWKECSRTDVLERVEQYGARDMLMKMEGVGEHRWGWRE